MNSAPRTIATTAEDASTRRRALLRASIKPVVFTVLLALASMAGAIPIPGTPVPITLQTLVVMVAALTMSWRQVACRRRLDRRPVRPERRIPDRLPAGRHCHRTAQGQGQAAPGRLRRGARLRDLPRGGERRGRG